VQRRQLGALVAGSVLAAAAAQAEEFPTRPVTIMVPFTAGGPSDVAMRVLAEELQKVWNQRVLVDNRPGGGTVIGTAAAARATPDGYTLAFAGGSFVVNAAVRRNCLSTRWPISAASRWSRTRRSTSWSAGPPPSPRCRT
jgi:tripartite-type tricarboxylate transporter receptor subunit TctC